MHLTLGLCSLPALSSCSDLHAGDETGHLSDRAIVGPAEIEKLMSVCSSWLTGWSFFVRVVAGGAQIDCLWRCVGWDDAWSLGVRIAGNMGRGMPGIEHPST